MEMISEAIQASRLPASLVKAVLYGYLDVLGRESAQDAARILAKLARSRDAAIAFHHATKQGMVLGTLRDLVSDMSVIEGYIEHPDQLESDPDLLAVRRGVFRISSTLH